MKPRTFFKNTALTALLAATASAQAEESSTDRFVMAVYEDMAQGRAILDGSPGETIEALSRISGGKIASFEESINLCVAYAQVKRIVEATVACDAAVAKAERKTAASRRRSNPYFSTKRRIARTDQAIALSNRAVLHALSGELDEAKALLEKAVILDPRRKFARSNLTRIEEDFAARL
jgi:hypothetical protein